MILFTDRRSDRQTDGRTDVFSRTIFFVSNNGVGGGMLDYAPSWTLGHLSWTKLTRCTTLSSILQNETIIRPLGHIHLTEFFFAYVAWWDPMVSGLYKEKRGTLIL